MTATTRRKVGQMERNLGRALVAVRNAELRAELLERSLTALIARIVRCAGYADHDEQQALWVARGLLRGDR